MSFNSSLWLPSSGLQSKKQQPLFDSINPVSNHNDSLILDISSGSLKIVCIFYTTSSYHFRYGKQYSI